MRTQRTAEGGKFLLSGSKAVALAVRDARAEVITAYPVTPEIGIVEQLGGFCAKKEMNARLINVESSHSAMATLIGAAAAGARTFAATSSQGLALMHEMLHWAAGDRLPIVVANVNRALGAPWSIWVDHNDSLSQRDTGWIQFYVSSCQEAYDTILQAYKIGELVQLPVLVNLDGYYLSHTVEPVEIADPKVVDSFLPSYRPEWRLDPQDPRSIGNLTSPDYYFEFRYKIQQSMDRANTAAEDVCRQFQKTFGREYAGLETYELEGADTVFISYATMAQTVKHAVREMRAEGKKVGLIRIRMFRPFPAAQLRELVKPDCTYLVLDRNISFGSGGVFGQEVKASLYPSDSRASVFGITLGLGGRDVTPSVIKSIAHKYSGPQAVTVDQLWEGVRL
jgi:pyruvate/2-oxoacid:ferredoxin oxidoreductase alpha subunit